MPGIDDLNKQLTDQVPEKQQFSFPESAVKPKKEIVVKANARANEILNNAKISVVNSYVTNEEERTKRQKPLLYAIVAITAFQLVSFNVIIACCVFLAFKNNDPTILTQLFEVMKYYIGATIVELIGMVWFITKGTFSTNHVKTMELMLRDEVSKQANNDEK